MCLDFSRILERLFLLSQPRFLFQKGATEAVIHHGYHCVCCYFPPGKARLGAPEESRFERVSGFGDVVSGLPWTLLLSVCGNQGLSPLRLPILPLSSPPAPRPEGIFPSPSSCFSNIYVLHLSRSPPLTSAGPPLPPRPVPPPIHLGIPHRTLRVLGPQVAPRRHDPVSLVPQRGCRTGRQSRGAPTDFADKLLCLYKARLVPPVDLSDCREGVGLFGWGGASAASQGFER